MKNYLEALQEYENSNNSFNLLCNFIAVKNSDLIKLYCNGKMHLPSFILLKKLYIKFSDLIDEDKELEMLFTNAIKCSKLFYVQTIKIINDTNDSEKEFEYIFAQKSQPLGQQLINLLLNIKYRIRMVRLRRQSSKKESIMQLVDRLTTPATSLFNIVNNFVYKIKLIQSTYDSLTRKLYYLIVIIALIGCWAVNFLFFKNISTLSITLINIIFCIAITVIAVATHPVRHFGLIDITGKNLVAYKYKAFFNNLSNRKMYNIFTLQHINDPGHINNQSIKSPKYRNT